MINDILRPKEKKVEYVELIYDLIFVYIVGRNNLLLHNFENGFISSAAFMAYIMTTLAVIQIWNFTTYYVPSLLCCRRNTGGLAGISHAVSYCLGLDPDQHRRAVFDRAAHSPDSGAE